MPTAAEAPALHEKRRESIWRTPGELRRHRRTLALLTRQDIKSTYTKYKLGVLWTLGEPFLMAVLMWFVLALLMGGSRGARIGMEPFLVYLVTGMYPFSWLRMALGKSPKTFSKFGNFVEFSPLPIVVWPMRSVLVGLSEFVFSIPIIAGFIVIGGRPVTWGVLLFPVGMALQFLLCLGVAMIFASLALKIPDVAMMSGLVTRMLFWMSPILWSSRDFPAIIQSLLYLNPFHGVLDFYRAALWPEVLGSWTDYAMSFGVIAVIFIVGLALIHARTDEIRRMA